MDSSVFENGRRNFCVLAATKVEFSQGVIPDVVTAILNLAVKGGFSANALGDEEVNHKIRPSRQEHHSANSIKSMRSHSLIASSNIASGDIFCAPPQTNTVARSHHNLLELTAKDLAVAPFSSAINAPFGIRHSQGGLVSPARPGHNQYGRDAFHRVPLLPGNPTGNSFATLTRNPEKEVPMDSKRPWIKRKNPWSL